MLDQSTVESFDPFRSRVGQLIDLENAGGGKGHFSFEAQQIPDATAIDLAELDDTDRARLELFTTSLEETITLLDTDPEELSDEYRLKILAKLNALMKPVEAPTQKLFRAYLNNKFSVLLGQIQLYASAQERNDTKTLEIAAQELREAARVYMPILKWGR